MSGEVKSYYRLHCDAGCGAHIDGDTSKDSRRIASEAGWQFPPKLCSDGSPAKRTHDVCPACAEEFEAELTPTAREWVGMPSKERRLRMMLQTNRFLLSDDERQRLEAKLEAMERERLGPLPSDKPTNEEARAWFRGDAR